MATDTIGMDQGKEKEEKASSYLFLFSPSHLSSGAPNLSLFMNLVAVSPPLGDHLKGNTKVFMRSGLHSCLLRDLHPRVNDEAIRAEYFGVKEGGG